MKTTISRNGNGFAVCLSGAPDRKGFCEVICKGIFATLEAAKAEADRVANLYQCAPEVPKPIATHEKQTANQV